MKAEAQVNTHVYLVRILRAGFLQAAFLAITWAKRGWINALNERELAKHGTEFEHIEFCQPDLPSNMKTPC